MSGWMTRVNATSGWFSTSNEAACEKGPFGTHKLVMSRNRGPNAADISIRPYSVLP